MRRLDLLQNAANLLHNVHIIKKCRNRHCKMRGLLQNASLLYNAEEQCGCVIFAWCSQEYDMLCNWDFAKLNAVPSFYIVFSVFSAKLIVTWN